VVRTYHIAHDAAHKLMPWLSLGIETEISELENLDEGKLDQKQKARLKELRAEVERIRKIKQDYVAAHPEQSHLVRGLEGSRRRQEPNPSGSMSTPPFEGSLSQLAYRQCSPRCSFYIRQEWTANSS
jgi:hypothetical protein